MGDYADMILDGTVDEATGEWNFDGEDGPGFPVSAADAHLYRDTVRASAPPDHLTGFWLRIAMQMTDDRITQTPDEIAARLGPYESRRKGLRERRAVREALQKMQRKGLVHCTAGRWFLTRKGRLQMIAGAEA